MALETLCFLLYKKYPKYWNVGMKNNYDKILIFDEEISLQLNSTESLNVNLVIKVPSGTVVVTHLFVKKH